MDDLNRYSIKMLAKTMADAKWSAEIEGISTEKWISLAISERAVRVRRSVEQKEAARVLSTEKGA